MDPLLGREIEEPRATFEAKRESQTGPETLEVVRRLAESLAPSGPWQRAAEQTHLKRRADGGDQMPDPTKPTREARATLLFLAVQAIATVARAFAEWLDWWSHHTT